MFPESVVWTVDAVGYPEECYQLGIAASEEAAIRLLKETYKPPYKVVWTQEREDDGSLTMTGTFEAIPGYSTEHEATYVIASCEVFRG